MEGFEVATAVQCCRQCSMSVGWPPLACLLVKCARRFAWLLEHLQVAVATTDHTGGSGTPPNNHRYGRGRTDTRGYFRNITKIDAATTTNTKTTSFDSPSLAKSTHPETQGGGYSDRTDRLTSRRERERVYGWRRYIAWNARCNWRQDTMFGAPMIIQSGSHDDHWPSALYSATWTIQSNTGLPTRLPVFTHDSRVIERLPSGLGYQFISVIINCFVSC